MKKRILITALSLQFVSFYHINAMDLLVSAAIQCIPTPKISAHKNPLGALLQKVEDPKKQKATISTLISNITIRCNPEETLKYLTTANQEGIRILHELKKQEMKNYNQDNRLHTTFGRVCLVGSGIASTIPLNMTQKMIRGILPPEYDNLATIATWTAITIGTFLMAKQQLDHKNQNKNDKDTIKSYEKTLYELAYYQKQLFDANPNLQSKYSVEHREAQAYVTKFSITQKSQQ